LDEEAFVRQSECSERRKQSCAAIRDLAEEQQRTTALLKEHHAQASEICKDVDDMSERMAAIERNLSRTTETLDRAASIINANALQQKWMQEEITAGRKDQYRVLWRTVGLLAVVIGALMGLKTLGVGF